MNRCVGKRSKKKKLKQLSHHLQKVKSLLNFNSKTKGMKFSFVLIFLPLLSFSQSLETIIQKGHELAVVAVAVSKDSNYVATASRDKSAKLWEMNTGREVRSFLGHEATVTSIEFTSDGKYLISGSNDKTVRIWDVYSGKALHTLVTTDIVTEVAIDPSMKFFVIAGYGNSGFGDSATIYDFQSRKIIKRLPTSADKGLGAGSRRIHQSGRKIDCFW